MFSCVVGREEHCKQISLACVGSACSVYGPHWVCPSSWQCVLPLHCSSSRFLKPALQGCCPNWALRFMHFPGLSCSGSGSQVLHKGTDTVGPVFCALPSSEQLRQPCAWQAHLPRWAVSLNHHPLLATWFPGCAAGVPSQVCCVSPLGS